MSLPTQLSIPPMSECKNVVMVTVDSLRADYCGFSGGTESHTPALDQHASDGFVFENAIAPGPATLDSLPVIFTGSYYSKWETEASPVEEPELVRDFVSARETIPEQFAERGYETAGFTTNPWTSRQYGFDQGFDHFEDFMDASDSNSLLDRLGETVRTGSGSQSELLRLLLNWQQQNDMFQSLDTFYDDVIEWTRQAEEPYFLWLFLVDTHMPFLPVGESRSQSILETYLANLWLYLDSNRLESVFGPRLRAAYADTVRAVDSGLDRLITDLAADEAVVVVHGDHGEEFGERQVYGHGHALSEELIRTPLFVANGPTGRVERPFSLSELPSLLERLAEDQDVADLTEPFVRSRNRDPKIAARGTNWKYVESENEERLYRISNSGVEQRIDDADLLSLGQDIVAHWRTAEAERQAIVQATGRISESEPI